MFTSGIRRGVTEEEVVLNDLDNISDCADARPSHEIIHEEAAEENKKMLGQWKQLLLPKENEHDGGSTIEEEELKSEKLELLANSFAKTPLDRRLFSQLVKVLIQSIARRETANRDAGRRRNHVTNSNPQITVSSPLASDRMLDEACDHLRAMGSLENPYVRKWIVTLLYDYRIKLKEGKMLDKEPLAGEDKLLILHEPIVIEDEDDEEKQEVLTIPAERQIDALIGTTKWKKDFDIQVAGLIVSSWNMRKAWETSNGTEEEWEEICAPLRGNASQFPSDVGPATKIQWSSFQPLSNPQRQIVKSAMRHRLTVVRGPPGTGKTYTSCAVIHAWTLQGLNVLAVAQSNQACENLCRKLNEDVPGVKAVRIGMSMRHEELLDQETFREALGEENLEGFMIEIKKVKPKIMKYLMEVVKKVDVVVTSCIAGGHPALLKDSTFQRVLMEEAGQITEPTSMVPLWWGAQGVCLIGDDRQLPPTVFLSDEDVTIYDLYPLNVSLFERLIDWKLVSEEAGTFFRLDEQFRMHPSLSEFPRLHTYKDQVLNDAKQVKDYEPVSGFNWPENNDHRAAFIDVVNGYEDRCGTSYSNQEEANLIVCLLRNFLQHGMDREQIAVVSPYRAQVNLIKRQLENQIGPGSHVKVATADSFQGSERDLIIFSTVRCRNEVGFLKDSRRCNVIMTRAKKGLIVLGNRRTMDRETNYWSPWLQWMESKKASFTHRDLDRLLLFSGDVGEGNRPLNNHHVAFFSHPHRVSAPSIPIPLNMPRVFPSGMVCPGSNGGGPRFLPLCPPKSVNREDDQDVVLSSPPSIPFLQQQQQQVHSSSASSMPHLPGTKRRDRPDIESSDSDRSSRKKRSAPRSPAAASSTSTHLSGTETAYRRGPADDIESSDSDRSSRKKRSAAGRKKAAPGASSTPKTFSGTETAHRRSRADDIDSSDSEQERHTHDREAIRRANMALIASICTKRARI